jgi:hypothetical protein
MALSGRRLFARLLAILLLLGLVHVVALNVFLNSGWILSKINKHPEKLQMSYAWAWSLWPTRVQLDGFRLRGADDHMRWSLSLESARVHVQVRDLFDRTFHALEVEGAGFTARFEPLPVPEAEGSEDESDDPEPPDPDRKRPWTVRLDAIRIGRFRELRFDCYRFAGDGKIDGHLFFRPKELLRVDPTTIEARDVEMFQDEHQVAHDISARIVAAIDEADPRKLKGLELVRAIRASASIRSEGDGIGFLGYYLQNSPLRLAGGSGPMRAQLRIEHGAFLPGSELEADAKDLRVDVPSYAIQGSGRVQWRVQDAGSRPDMGTETTLTLGLDHYALQADGFDRPHVRGTGLRIWAGGKNTTIFDPIRDLAVNLDIPGAEIPDVTVYAAMLPPSSGLDLRSGSGSMQASFQASSITNIANGGVTVHAEEVRSSWEQLQLGGDWTLTTRLVKGDVKNQVYDLSGTVFLLQNVGVADMKAPLKKREKRKIQGWWGNATLLDAWYTPGRPVLLTAKLKIRMRDARPVIEMFSKKKELPGFVKKIFVANNLTATARLTIGDDLVDVEDFVLEADDIEIWARLQVRAGHMRGLLYVKYGVFSVGVELKDDDTDLKIFRARKWFLKYPPFEGR